MSSERTERGRGLGPAAVLGVLIVVAFGLRFWRLGDWSFDSDETFMLRDSLRPHLTNPRPLLYFLNHYLVAPLLPLDELGLRLLPALFGVLAIPAIYLVGRRLVGPRAALLGAGLLTFSPLHVYYSQFARYWSLVFLLCSVYPFVLYLGVRDRNPRTLVLGFLAGIVATLAHPASVILVGGLGLWVLLTYLKRERLAQLWSHRSVRWGTLLAAVLLVVIALRFVPMLENWISEKRAPGTGEFLFHIPAGRGVRQISFLLSYVESLTLPLVLAGAAGIYWLWQGRDRSLAILLGCLFTFQVAFILLLSFVGSISTFYMVPAIPTLFFGAGVFLDRLGGIEWELRPRWLLPAIVAVMIVAAGAPTLVSQYRDGRRWDFRGVARWLDPRLAPEDVVFSDQAMVLLHYLPRANVHRLSGDSAPLVQSVRMLEGSGRGGTLWIVAPAPSHAFRTNSKLASLNRWMYDNCQLRNLIGVGRVDFRQQFLQIYRCQPAGQGESAGANESPLRSNTAR